MAKKGLGKGLEALLPENIEEVYSSSAGIHELKLTSIEPNKNQPRKNFDDDKIEALADSIKQHGIIQPIIVTDKGNGFYGIIAGERRWRAAKKAGLKTVPVIIKEYSSDEAAQIALIENLQREDLNSIEEALGYKSLIDEYKMTQEAISQKIGKSRSAIANSLRLLTLDKNIQKLIINGELTSGHARAVLSLTNKNLQNALIKRIIDDELNVRQAETLAKQLLKASPKKTKKTTPQNIELEALENRLSSSFGTKVKISQGTKKSKIEIEYYNNDDLERILSLLNLN